MKKTFKRTCGISCLIFSVVFSITAAGAYGQTAEDEIKAMREELELARRQIKVMEERLGTLEAEVRESAASPREDEVDADKAREMSEQIQDLSKAITKGLLARMATVPKVIMVVPSQADDGAWVSKTKTMVPWQSVLRL